MIWQQCCDEHCRYYKVHITLLRPHHTVYIKWSSKRSGIINKCNLQIQTYSLNKINDGASKMNVGYPKQLDLIW